MREDITLATLASEFRNHQRECVNESRQTRESIDRLIEWTDGVQANVWKAIGACVFVIFSGMVGYVFTNWNEAQTAAVQSKAIVQAVAASSANNRKIILDAINANAAH